MKEAYIEKRFRKASLELIATIDSIIREYQQAGYVLTVRQLYYQLVARGYIENTERSYQNTTGLVNDARLAGLLDWEAIEDRTRAFERRGKWSSGADILEACASSFHMDMWKTQSVRPFVIVEKEALAGVLQATCHDYDVPLLAARGYPSVSILREFAQQILSHVRHEKQEVVILHLGDHDPSGIDMTRDIRERLQLLTHYRVLPDVRRLALNMDQIEEQQPPPNPAKVTDSRFQEYERLYGYESWELDALQPEYMNRLIIDELETLIEPDPWETRKEEIEDIKARLSDTARQFNDFEG